MGHQGGWTWAESSLMGWVSIGAHNSCLWISAQPGEPWDYDDEIIMVSW
jgi:hypothetical protein